MEHLSNRPIPVLPIRNTVLFPGVAVPLRVGRPRSVAALQRANASDQWILTVTQNEHTENEPTASQLYRVGTLCKIERMRGSAENGYQVLVRGVARFQVAEFVTESGVLLARGETFRERHDADAKTLEALTKGIKDLAKAILEMVPGDTEQIEQLIDGVEDPIYLIDLAAGHLEATEPEKQRLLEETSLKARALALLELMQKQKDQLEVQGEIREKLSSRLGKTQREAILREQMKAIREELGEGSEGVGGDDFRKKIEDAGMPEEAKKLALEELKKLETIGNSSPESHVIRNYLELLVAMPWSKSSTTDLESLDLQKVRATLDADHYGLDKIKRRIVQHLAVMKLRARASEKTEGKGSILLFVGPPGVGKTSLGQSIAKALGRKFVRGALGGVRDEAEIRGHRRTYIGAMAGRIVQGIKRAGENDPVFLLDEIDKLARGWSGDPQSALLEVLDPEQNKTFSDHYLDTPWDLSKVFFIATANSLETIPAPLLDRMEVIDLSGYTAAEKLHIARSHLVPKQLKEHGLSPEQVTIPDETLVSLISRYTREAGVRELQRRIAAACRAASEKVLMPEAKLPFRVEARNLEDLIGPERYQPEVAETRVPPGVVTGLAWTPMGGEILFVESSLMPGSGKLTLTGQLGDVMKESAQIALSLVRSRLAALVPGFEFEKNDVHVHFPAGAIPKDGPSAGIALLTTIASLFSDRSVNPKLAMTGEVTLRGAVLPVGGIKEKVMAAHRAGIEKVILPKRNQKDLKEVPEEVRSQLKIEFVENVTEVLKIALGLEVEGNELPAAAKSPQAAPVAH